MVLYGRLIARAFVKAAEYAKIRKITKGMPCCYSPEQQARRNIDKLLEAAAWHVCGASAANIYAARGDRLPVMKFTLSKHAEDTMRERAIDFAWLTATMNAPEITEQHPDDQTLMFAFRRIPEFGNWVLRVVYNRTKIPPHIVTAYFDRTAGGKR